MESKEKLKNYCANCSRITSHIEIHRKTTGSKPYDGYDWSKDFLIVECAGCENVSFRIEYCSEDSIKDPDTDERIIDVKTYPSVLKNRKELQDTYLLPFYIKIAYEESITTFKNDCKLLTAAGFRAVIEAVCKDKGISGSEIKGKIDNLFKKGFLSQNEADRLHAVRFLGNDSIHEIAVPTEEQLYSCLIIIEHLLTNLYLIDKLISNTIDKMIVKYYFFEELLDFLVANLDKGIEKSLKEILGKDLRRISSNNFKKFEQELQIKIRKGEYKELALGRMVKEKNRDKEEFDVQNYIIVNEKDISVPKRRTRFLGDYLNGEL